MFMTKAEQDIIFEIQEYYIMIEKTQSDNRKSQLLKHINKLKKQLKVYRNLRYNN